MVSPRVLSSGFSLFNATIDTFEAASKDVAKYLSIGGSELTSVPPHDR